MGLAKHIQKLAQKLTGFYPYLKSFWSCSHMNCCLHYMLHINLHILYINFIKLNLNLKEFQESNKYIKSYQENKIESLDESYFKLKVHWNLNIKLDFQENSCFSTSLHYSHVNIIKLFSMSCHVTMVLIMKNESYDDLKHEPNANPKSKHDSC